jgi:hypothetical protein
VSLWSIGIPPSRVRFAPERVGRASRITGLPKSGRGDGRGGPSRDLAPHYRRNGPRLSHDFSAGLGDTEARAIGDAEVNLAPTTFHVVYRAFLNPDDPHTESSRVVIGGEERELLAGDLYVRRSDSVEALDLKALSGSIREALTGFPLPPGPHWIKVVYGQADNAPITVAVTLDWITPTTRA